MKIETKFDIFDHVYFICNKNIFYGRISAMILEEKDVEDMIYRIEYDYFYVAYLTEKELFTTKEEAEQRLKEIENTADLIKADLVEKIYE